MIYDVEEILRIAKQNGLNQKKLLQRAKVDKGTFNRIRRGETVNPRLATMVRLIEAATK